MSETVDDTSSVSSPATAEDSTEVKQSTKKRKVAVKQGNGDANAVVHHTFDAADEVPKKKKLEQVVPVAPVVSSEPEKKETGGEKQVEKILFTDVDFSKFKFGAIEFSPKNRAKSVPIEYGTGDELFITPKMYVGYGFFKNETGYSLNPVFMGVPPDWTHGSKPAPEMESNTELMDRVAFFEACLQFDEFFIELAFQRSEEWWGKKVSKDRIRQMYRPLAVPSKDKLDDTEYSRTFRLTFPVSQAGKPQFRMYQEGSPKDLSPDNYVQKEMKQWARFAFLLKKVTFPNTGNYKLGIQVVVYQMAVLKGNPNAKFIKATNVF